MIRDRRADLGPAPTAFTDCFLYFRRGGCPHPPVLNHISSLSGPVWNRPPRRSLDSFLYFRRGGSQTRPKAPLSKGVPRSGGGIHFPKSILPCPVARPSPLPKPVCPRRTKLAIKFLTSRREADKIGEYIARMRRKGQVPASKTHREPPFGARRTGGRGEDPLGAEG